MINHIDELSTGDFIKVVQIDGPVAERLNLSGEVIRLYGSTGRFEVKTMSGIIGMGMDMEDAVIEVHRLKQKPNGWDNFIKSGEKLPKTKVKTKPPLESKKVKVFNLVKNNPKKRFPGLLKLALSDIGGDENMLSTYITLAISKIR